MAKYLAWVKQNIYEFPVAEKKQKNTHLPSVTMPVAVKKQKNTHLPSATMHPPPPPAIHTPQCKRYFGGFFGGKAEC